MEKISEDVIGGFYNKVYDTGKKVSVLEIIKQLLAASVQIQYVEIREGVERDAQVMNGKQYNVQDFINSHKFLSTFETDISYMINADYNNMNFFVMVDEDVNTILLMTDSQNVELDDIIGQKKNEGLTNTVM